MKARQKRNRHVRFNEDLQRKSQGPENPVEGLETEKRNRIVIERDILPIIFVPGIMGSRLKKPKRDTIWDPDDKWLMLKNYGLFWGASAKPQATHDRPEIRPLLPGGL